MTEPSHRLSNPAGQSVRAELIRIWARAETPAADPEKQTFSNFAVHLFAARPAAQRVALWCTRAPMPLYLWSTNVHVEPRV
jgi:hypothetical protein